MYTYTYDVFNRLVAVKTTDTTPAEVGQYRYNGLGQRIAFRHDEDADADVDDEKWANVVYDERWRMIAAYHQDDDDPTDAPKERFVYHAAGAGGSGSSSYIDDTILRDRDHNTAWATASDGTLERRDFHCQNWRADVIALVEPDADIVEHVRYGLSGEPFAISPADVTYAATNPSSGLGVPNGVVDNGGDYSHYLNMYTAGTDPRADFNHDGAIDSGDFFAYLGKHTADTGKDWGRGVLSGVESRKGYAGYERDRAAGKLWHVRFRVFDNNAARWLRRDPLGYYDHWSLYTYVGGENITLIDPKGLYCSPAGCSSGASQPTTSPNPAGPGTSPFLMPGRPRTVTYDPSCTLALLPMSDRSRIWRAFLKIANAGCDVRGRCPGGVRIVCTAEEYSYADRCTIYLGRNYGIAVPRPLIRDIDHELRHVWQYCHWGLPVNDAHYCRELICREMDAYLFAAGGGYNLKTSKGRKDLCTAACRSVRTGGLIPECWGIFGAGLCRSACLDALAWGDCFNGTYRPVRRVYPNLPAPPAYYPGETPAPGRRSA